MPVTIKVRADFSRVSAFLDGTIRQIPFATARALTATAKNAQRAVESEIASDFDRPVPFTKKAVGITAATKVQLRSVVFLKRKQAAYLEAQIKGGPRRLKPFEAQLGKEQRSPLRGALPGAGLQLNQFGNIPKQQIIRLAKQARGRKSNVFYPKVGDKLAPGLYQRQQDGGVKPLIIFSSRPPQYRKRLDFYNTIAKAVQSSWQREFSASLQSAIASKR